MIQLYYASTCPFCVRVLDFLAQHDIPFEKKEMQLGQDGPVRQELMQLTGKGQVPYLVDPEREVRMHERGDILEYLQQHYAK